MRSYPRAAAVAYLSVSKVAFSVLMLVIGIRTLITPITIATAAVSVPINTHCRTTRLRLFLRYSFDRSTGCSAAGSPARSNL